MTPKLSVFVVPRSGEHYQDLLYRDFEALGVRVRYTKGPTPSQSLNIILSPVVLMWYRARGFRILHVHWLFQFSLPWARRQQWARQLMEWWFDLYLRTAQLLGYRIVWTAHDLLPHEQIFADDRRARDSLLSKTSAVIALSESTAIELRSLGARLVRVIPIGPYADPYPVRLTREEARASIGFSDDDVVVSLIGRVEEYKGVEELLAAIAELPSSSKIKLLLVGYCPEQNLRERVNRLIGETRGRTVSRLEWVPDEDLARYYQATDVAVFPFREITNSASLLLAQSFAKPVVIPDLPALRDIPGDAVTRYEPGADSLLAALERVEHLSEAEYLKMSAAGLAWATRFDWTYVARETIATYEEVSPR
ncbi:MAG: glycosyltransferase family 4 protein [Acidimicrobiales bacterium]